MAGSENGPQKVCILGPKNGSKTGIFAILSMVSLGFLSEMSEKADFSSFSAKISQNWSRNKCLSGINWPGPPKLVILAKMTDFVDFWPVWPEVRVLTLESGQFLTKLSKIVKNGTFRHPRVTHPRQVWKFCLKIPIQATNFPDPVVWDGQKYQTHFRLSVPPVYPNRIPVFKRVRNRAH